MKRKCNYFFSGTFVIDPLLEPMLAWLDRFPDEYQLHFLAYNQLFQDLTTHAEGKHAEQSVFIILIRFQDWCDIHSTHWQSQLESNIHIFNQQLSCAIAKNPISYILCLCPSQTLDSMNHSYNPFGKQLLTLIKENPQVQIIQSHDIFTIQEQDLIFNDYTDTIGHIPYSEFFYKRLAQALCRTLYGWHYNSYKVIILDCDNTLWKGACGEMGPQEIVINNEHLFLQKLVLKQHEAGVLLCLCSKNNEADVWAVFQNNPAMLLKPEHFVCAAINWQPKSINIKKIAQDLKFAEDSFIMIDDNPVECAEINSNCPAVLVLQLPQSLQKWPEYLNKIWAFHRLASVTNADQQRIVHYQQEMQRTTALERSASFSKFIESLNLTVSMRAIEKADIARVSQLTHRTNQFNCAKQYIDEASLQNLLGSNKSTFKLIEVSDRFGNYGIVGVICYHSVDASQLIVTMFLLSCRVLGRGVEHQVAVKLGLIAQASHLTQVIFRFIPTERNNPAHDFLMQLNPLALKRLDGVIDFLVNTSQLLKTKFNPNKLHAITKNKQSKSSSQPSSHNKQNFWQKTLINYCLEQKTEEFSQANNRITLEHQAILSDLRELFKHYLAKDQISDQDDFFQLGGHSLKAVLLLGEIYKNYKKAFTVNQLETNCTPLQLANLILSDPVVMSVPAIKKTQSQEAFFSLQQQRLWLHSLLFKNSAAYNVADALRLKGPLAIKKFVNALAKTYEKNTILQTQIVYQNEKPIQQRFPDQALPFKIVAQTCSALDDYLESEIARPFPLINHPLCRFQLITIDNNLYVFLMIFHHLIIDEWSLQLVYKDLAAYYNEEDHFLLSSSYFDYVHWQSHRLEEKQGSLEDLAYWRKQLNTAPAQEDPLALYTQSLHPTNALGKNQQVSLELNATCTDKLLRFSYNEGLGLFNILLTTFFHLLFHYSDQQRLVIATPMADRSHPDTHDLVGLFSQLFPIFLDINSSISFQAFVAQVKTTIDTCQIHQEVMLNTLLAENADSVKKLDYSWLQTIFVFYNKTKVHLNLENVKTEAMFLPSAPETFFNLNLTVIQDQQGLTIQFNYRADVFEKEFILQLAQHYVLLLEQSLEMPQTILKDFSLITQKDQFLLKKWNQQTNIQKIHQSIVPTFLSIVQRFANNVALKQENRTLTYSQLNEMSNRIVHCISNSIAPKSIIAVAITRSIEAIIAHLAVLKSNCTILPIDPYETPERIKNQLKETKATLLVTVNSSFGLAQKLNIPCLILENSLKKSFSDRPHEFHDNPPVFSKTAYILYTSGTTNKPKGIKIPHDALIDLVNNLGFFTIKSTDIIAHVTNLSFDPSLLEIWGALLKGAICTIVPQKQKHWDPIFMGQQLKQQKITILVMTTASFSQLVHYDATIFEGMKHLIIGGEILSPRVVSLLYEQTKNPILYNGYGPTEATVLSTLYPVPRDQIPKNTIPIGTPVGGKHIFILDSYHRLLPPGIWGEIFIGGNGLSYGYLNKEKINFIQEKILLFSDDKLSLYATGDRGRWLPNGIIEFGGRYDQQIKFCGHRISLVAIEKQLISDERVSNAVVTVINNHNTPDTLAAFVVLTHNIEKESERKTLEEALLQSLRSIFPHFLVPTYCFIMDTLPISTQGKIDHRALAKMLPLRSKYLVQEANDAIEFALIKIFHKLLPFQDITKTTNFFAAGGSSLQLIQLLEMINASFGTTLDLSIILNDPSVQELYTQIRQLKGIDKQSLPPCIFPIETRVQKPILFLIHPVSGLTTDYYQLASYLNNYSVYGITAPVWLRDHQRFKTLEQMAEYYARAIKHTQSNGPYYLGGWSFGGNVALAIASYLRKINETVVQLVLLDSYNINALDPTIFSDRLTIEVKEADSQINSVIADHIRLGRNFCPKPYDDKVLFIAGRSLKEGHQNPEKLLANRGWTPETLKNVTVFTVPCQHEDLLNLPHVKKIAEIMESSELDVVTELC